MEILKIAAAAERAAQEDMGALIAIVPTLASALAAALGYFTKKAVCDSKDIMEFKLEGIKSDVATIKEAIKATDKKFETIDSRVSRLEVRLESAAAKLESSSRQLEIDRDKLDRRVTELERRAAVG